MKILIAGSHGVLGSVVTKHLIECGHQVTRLVRSEAAPDEAWWDPDAGKIDASRLEGFDGVVNLATRPWPFLRPSKKSMQQLLSNRLATNGLLARSLAACTYKPRVLVCASGMSYYASSGETLLAEDGPAGMGFCSNFYREAEASTASASAAGIRVVHLRIPLVMGGPMVQLLGFQAGEGKQWMSWVGRDELASIIEFTLKTEVLSGPVNACSPNPLRNAELATTSTQALGIKAGGAMPVFILKMSMGEYGEDIYLSSRRLQPAKLLAAGYPFRFPDLTDCLQHEKAYPDAKLPASAMAKPEPAHS